jgi:hypothetical protein
MKIKKIVFLYLRNDEHFQFCTDFINLVNSVGAAKLKVQTQFKAFVDLNREEDEALKKITKSALTEKIAEADHARDEVFRGLTEANRAALNHFTPAVREAAKRLQIVFDTYGNVARKPVAEESSALYNLIHEVTGHHADDMETLNLGGWIVELDRLNNAVQELMSERYDENASRTSLVLKEVRAREDEAYRTITERIDALRIVEGDEIEVDPDQNDGAVSIPTPWADFIRRLNAIIDRTGDILAQRRGRSSAKKKPQENSQGE